MDLFFVTVPKIWINVSGHHVNQNINLNFKPGKVLIFDVIMLRKAFFAYFCLKLF